MAEETAPTMALEHVNVPPMQTWNYLRANGTSLTVPVPRSTGAVLGRLPRLFNRLDCAIGKGAERWVSDSSDESRYVEVPAFAERDEPIVIDVSCDKGEARDTGIIFREGSRGTVVICSHGTNDSTKTTSASLTRIIAKRGAEFELIEIVAATDSHQHLDGIGIELDEGAHATVRQYFLGGRKVVAGIATDLRGDNSRIDLSGHYYVRGQEELDVNQIARARGLNTYEEMLTTGFLGDQARKTLRMTIDLIHGSSGSKGNEVETVMGFGPDVVNRTLPVILCDEDDVQGNHGATIGGISQDQVDYLAVRGLNEKGVDELLVRALFDDAAINAVTPATRTAVLERAAQVLGSEVANDITEGLGLATEKA